MRVPQPALERAAPAESVTRRRSTCSRLDRATTVVVAYVRCTRPSAAREGRSWRDVGNANVRALVVVHPAGNYQPSSSPLHRSTMHCSRSSTNNIVLPRVHRTMKRPFIASLNAQHLTKQMTTLDGKEVAPGTNEADDRWRAYSGTCRLSVAHRGGASLRGWMTALSTVQAVREAPAVADMFRKQRQRCSSQGERCGERAG